MTSPTIDTRWGEYTPNSAVVSNLDETYRQLRNLMDVGYSKRISEERKKAQRKDDILRNLSPNKIKEYEYVREKLAEVNNRWLDNKHKISKNERNIIKNKMQRIFELWSNGARNVLLNEIEKVQQLLTSNIGLSRGKTTTKSIRKRSQPRQPNGGGRRKTFKSKRSKKNQTRTN